MRFMRLRTTTSASVRWSSGMKSTLMEVLLLIKEASDLWFCGVISMIGFEC